VLPISIAAGFCTTWAPPKHSRNQSLRAALSAKELRAQGQCAADPRRYCFRPGCHRRAIGPYGWRTEADREVRSGGYHISQGDFRVHFGMGHATKADLTIRWPDGTVGNVETIPAVDANQWIVVREGRGIVERHPFTHDGP
jgi:hypothetical protein